SSRKRRDERIGPFPSRGAPVGSTTRPSSPGPTGTSATRPVRRTSSPALTARPSPRRITPTSSGSRLKARPMTPPESSTSSSAPTSGSPETRAVPRVTDRTVPISRSVSPGDGAEAARARIASVRASSRRSASSGVDMVRYRLRRLRRRMERVAQRFLEPVEVAVESPGRFQPSDPQLHSGAEIRVRLEARRGVDTERAPDRVDERRPMRVGRRGRRANAARLPGPHGGGETLALRCRHRPQPVQEALDHTVVQILVGELLQRAAHHGHGAPRDVRAEPAQEGLLLLLERTAPALAEHLHLGANLADLLVPKRVELRVHVAQEPFPLRLELRKLCTVSLPLRLGFAAQAPGAFDLLADARLARLHRTGDGPVEESAQEPDQQREIDELRDDGERIDQQCRLT